MSKLRIEEAQPEHADEIWKIIQTSFVGEHSPYIATGQPGYKDYLIDRLHQERSDNKILIVAKSSRHVAAFADITLNTEEANFLTRIAVARGFRGNGIVRQMMRLIHEAYKSGGQWELDVLSTNTGARNMYESFGFTTVSQRKWVGRLLPEIVNNTTVSNVSHESDDLYYLRYGFTTTQVQDRAVSIAGSAVRCNDISSFLDNSFLTKVREQFPLIDRAFIILDASDNRIGSFADAFEIVRSDRMTGSFEAC